MITNAIHQDRKRDSLFAWLSSSPGIGGLWMPVGNISAHRISQFTGLWVWRWVQSIGNESKCSQFIWFVASQWTTRTAISWAIGYTKTEWGMCVWLWARAGRTDNIGTCGRSTWRCTRLWTWLWAGRRVWPLAAPVKGSRVHDRWPVQYNAISLQSKARILAAGPIATIDLFRKVTWIHGEQESEFLWILSACNIFTRV